MPFGYDSNLWYAADDQPPIRIWGQSDAEYWSISDVQIHGAAVMWIGVETGDVVLWTPERGAQSLFRTDDELYFVAVDGGNVAWAVGGVDGCELYLYDGGTTTLVATVAEPAWQSTDPSSGDEAMMVGLADACLAWVERDSDRGVYRVMLAEAGSAPEVIHSSPAEVSGFDIAGGLIAWSPYDWNSDIPSASVCIYRDGAVETIYQEYDEVDEIHVMGVLTDGRNVVFSSGDSAWDVWEVWYYDGMETGMVRWDIPLDQGSRMELSEGWLAMWENEDAGAGLIVYKSYSVLLVQDDFEDPMEDWTTEGDVQVVIDDSGANNVLQLTESSDAIANRSIDLPTHAAELWFDHCFTDVGDGDSLVALLNGQEKFRFTGSDFLGEAMQTAGPFDVSDLAGQTVRLELRLSTVGDVNAQVWIDDVRVTTPSLPTMLPDLTVQQIPIPAAAGPGEIITVSADITNSGGGDAGVSFAGQFWLSSTPDINNPERIALGDAFTLPGLVVGEVAVVTIDGLLPEVLPPEEYFIGVELLAENVAESTRDNNVVWADETFTNELRITSDPATHALEDQEYAYDVQSNAEGLGGATYSLEQGPAQLSIDPITGLINGLFVNCAAGDYTVRVQADDGKGRSETQQYTLTVTNVAPVFIGAPTDMPATEDQAFNYDLNTDDEDVGGGVTYTLASGPSWLAVTDASAEPSRVPRQMTMLAITTSLFVPQIPVAA